MRVAIFEIGNFYDTPDIVRVFDSEATAIKNIPEGFVNIEECSYLYLYYENRKDEKYLNIKMHEVETSSQYNQSLDSDGKKPQVS